MVVGIFRHGGLCGWKNNNLLDGLHIHLGFYTKKNDLVKMIHQLNLNPLSMWENVTVVDQTCLHHTFALGISHGNQSKSSHYARRMSINPIHQYADNHNCTNIYKRDCDGVRIAKHC